MSWLTSPVVASALILTVPYTHARCMIPPNPAAPKHSRKQDVSMWLSSPTFIRSVIRFSWVTIAIVCAIQSMLMWASSHNTSHTTLKTSVMTCSTSSRPAIYIGPTVLLGWIIAICGCEFRVHTFRALGRMFTYELSITEKHQLVTWGPYSVVRHPSYTGMYVNIAGALTCMLSPGSWLRQCDVSESPVTMVVWVLVGLWIAYWSWMIQVFVKRAIQEDAMMRENFGKQWDEWSGRVKYRLVPGVF